MAEAEASELFSDAYIERRPGKHSRDNESHSFCQHAELPSTVPGLDERLPVLVFTEDRLSAWCSSSSLKLQDAKFHHAPPILVCEPPVATWGD